MTALVTLAELKTYLGITDSTNDARLTALISGVSDYVRGYCNRSFSQVDHSTNPLKLDGDGTDRLKLPDVAFIDKIEIYTEGNNATPSQTLDSSNLGTDWWYEPANYIDVGHPITAVVSDYLFPDGKWTVWVFGQFGWVTIPDGVKQAVFQMCDIVYNRMNSGGVESVSTGRVTVNYGDINQAISGVTSNQGDATSAIHALLDPFRRFSVGSGKNAL